MGIFLSTLSGLTSKICNIISPIILSILTSPITIAVGYGFLGMYWFDSAPVRRFFGAAGALVVTVFLPLMPLAQKPSFFPALVMLMTAFAVWYAKLPHAQQRGVLDQVLRLRIYMAGKDEGELYQLPDMGTLVEENNVTEEQVIEEQFEPIDYENFDFPEEQVSEEQFEPIDYENFDFPEDNYENQEDDNGNYDHDIEESSSNSSDYEEEDKELTWAHEADLDSF